MTNKKPPPPEDFKEPRPIEHNWREDGTKPEKGSRQPPPIRQPILRIPPPGHKAPPTKR